MVAHTRIPRSSLGQQAFEKGALQSVSSNARRINKGRHPSFQARRLAARSSAPWCRAQLTLALTISTFRPPDPEQTSRSRRSRTEVSAPYRAAAISEGVGLTACGLSTFSCDVCRAPVLLVSDADRT